MAKDNGALARKLRQWASTRTCAKRNHHLPILAEFSSSVLKIAHKTHASASVPVGMCDPQSHTTHLLMHPNGPGKGGAFAGRTKGESRHL